MTTQTCYTQRIKSIAVLMLALLAGCSVPERAPVSQTPSSMRLAGPKAADIYTPTERPFFPATIVPTVSTFVPQPALPTNIPHPTATHQPTPVPEPPRLTALATPSLARQEPRLVDALAVDQPWMLASSFRLLAVDNAGVLTQLRLPTETSLSITSWLARPGRTPLIVETSSTEAPVLLDPARGTHTTIAIQQGTDVSEFVLSPDASHIAFGAFPSDDRGESRLLIADVINGAVHAVAIHDLQHCASYDPSAADAGMELRCNPAYSVMPLAWRGHWLYLEGGGSPNVALWRIDLEARGAMPELVLSIGDGALSIAQPQGDHLLLLPLDAAPQLVNMRTGKVNDFVAQGCVMTSPGCHLAFSPDGKQLIYLTSPDPQGTTQLVRYDIARDESRVLQTFHGQVGAGVVFWLDGGRHILAQTISADTPPQSPQHTRALLLDDNGTLVDEASDDWARLEDVGDSGYVSLTRDNQRIAIMDEGYGQINVRALPFHASDTPRFPPVWLPDNNESKACEVVYVPPK